MPATSCHRCLAPLQPGDKLCPQCHALVYAEELEALRQQALQLEEQHNVAQALPLWKHALDLLPSEARQAEWVRQHISELEQMPPQEPKPAAEAHPWARRLGPLAPIAVVLAKGKTILFALFKAKSLLSFVAFFGVYWAMFGAAFGLGFAAMILIHEMGHYLEIRRRGLPAEMPVFLPGLGAYVQWQALGVSLEVRALVSLAGPLAGTLAALAAYAVFLSTRQPIWMALAHVGAWLNLLNLVPVWILDGAGAARPLDRMARGSLLVFCLVLWWWSGELTLLLPAAGFAWLVYRGGETESSSLRVQLLFATLLGVLGWLIHATPVAAGAGMR
jgi:Zn-dependent protease/uncharacterized Zn finger protein (UPF0148 family)